MAAFRITVTGAGARPIRIDGKGPVHDNATQQSAHGARRICIQIWPTGLLYYGHYDNIVLLAFDASCFHIAVDGVIGTRGLGSRVELCPNIVLFMST